MPNKLILLSAEDQFPHEIEMIARFFDLGLSKLHLRKPNWSKEALRAWLNELPSVYHPKIVIHDHHSLIQEFSLAGLHFNTRNPYRKIDSSFTKSISLHSLEEVHNLAPDIDYAFLSPIFNSISKFGYKAAFDEHSLAEVLKQTRKPIYALSGMNAKTIPKALAIGFSGIVVLGAIWNKSLISKFKIDG